MKKLVICLMVAVVAFLGSGLCGSDAHAMTRKVNEYEGQF